MNGNIFAFLTATAVTPDSEGRTDTPGARVEYGWIDPKWSMTTLFESRNDATPLVNCSINNEELADYVREALEIVFPYEYSDVGTFLGQSERVDENGTHWTYVIHFVHKYYGSNGWVETPWNPAEHGIELGR